MSTQQLLDIDIRFSTLVRADPERVWQALTTAEGYNQWFTSGAAWEQRPGARMTWRWERWGVDEVTVDSSGEVLEVDQPHRFAFTWENGSGPQPSIVTIRLAPHPHGTRVDLTDAGYPDTPEGRRAFMDCAGGWGEALKCSSNMARGISGVAPSERAGSMVDGRAHARNLEKSTPDSTIGTCAGRQATIQFKRGEDVKRQWGRGQRKGQRRC